MRLPSPFYRLPVRFDVERLQAEVRALAAGAWAAHPNEIPGNSSLRLISAAGGENDDVTGRMLPTAHLAASPYIRQVLESFGVVWSRSRLMRLAPGATVPVHADINYHWFWRVRVHIPVFTNPGVAFVCGDEQVHMAAGEAWVFDNWRPHHVENRSGEERIHLVADTSGTAAFWRFVAQSTQPHVEWREHRYDPARDAAPLTEHNVPAAVLPPAEAQLLLNDLGNELVALGDSPDSTQAVLRYRRTLEEFGQDWRQLVALHGSDAGGRRALTVAVDALRAKSRELGGELVMRTNRVAAHQVLEARVLRHLLYPAPAGVAAAPTGRRAGSAAATIPSPVFIVAAPRSGSTLLYETLAAHGAVATLGGEAHWLIEGVPELRPGAAGVDSNRLTADAATAAIAESIRATVRERLQDAEGQPASGTAAIFLEKTPKNSLRIPFLKRVFPDARFVFLWREPRGNVASIIEAWRSGRWVTYPELAGWDGPWSLLLPPQWRLMRGRPLEEIAAWQWDSANRIVLDDLSALPRGDWTAVRYDELVTAPSATVTRLCAFLGIDVDAALTRRLAEPLPHSRYTLAPPAADKWRAHEAALMRVLPAIESTRLRLEALR
jgi:Sulfotransferase family/Aspartyl/Asparaginyl beta-hydroxylase